MKKTQLNTLNNINIELNTYNIIYLVGTLN